MYLLNLYSQLLFAHPASLIAKSMLKVCEQGVAGTTSERGYPLPPLPRNVRARTCVCVCLSFFVSLCANTHPSICPISTCAEAQPPGTLTVKRLPEPSVAISSFNSTLTPLSFFSPHHAEFSNFFCCCCCFDCSRWIRKI